MCAWLGVNRASFYRWVDAQTAPPGPRAQRRETVGQRLCELHAQWDERPGRRPMQQLLAAEGEVCSLGLIHRLMQQHRLIARRSRHWRTTTRSRPGDPRFPNACQTPDGRRDFSATAPGDRVVSDITLIPTDEGWLSLTTVIDLATRAVVGWAMAEHMRASVVLEALAMAWAHHGVRSGTIVHSDHGSQYTSATVQRWCERHRIGQSMGRSGVCWDNAVAESWFATLKGDLRGHRFHSRAEARGWIVRYIEGWYNRVRPHASNGGVPPITAWTTHTSHPYGVSLS
jgi:putative transposase